MPICLQSSEHFLDSSPAPSSYCSFCHCLIRCPQCAPGGCWALVFWPLTQESERAQPQCQHKKARRERCETKTAGTTTWSRPGDCRRFAFGLCSYQFVAVLEPSGKLVAVYESWLRFMDQSSGICEHNCSLCYVHHFPRAERPVKQRLLEGHCSRRCLAGRPRTVVLFMFCSLSRMGVFYAELNELLTRELAEDGYSGVEVRVTPMRTEIIIRATRTQNVLGKLGDRNTRNVLGKRRSPRCVLSLLSFFPMSTPVI